MAVWIVFSQTLFFLASFC